MTKQAGIAFRRCNQIRIDIQSAPDPGVALAARLQKGQTGRAAPHAKIDKAPRPPTGHGGPREVGQPHGVRAAPVRALRPGQTRGKRSGGARIRHGGQNSR